jgi:hypothetical protein
MKRLFIAQVLIAVIAFLQLPYTLSAHDIHISYCNASLAKRTCSGRLTVFSDDYWKAVNALNGTDVRLLEDSRRHAAILRYVQRYFKMTANGGVAMKLTQLITGVEGSSTWIDFSMTSPVDITEVRIENRMLLDLYSDQMNLMVVSSGAEEKNLVCSQDVPSVVLRREAL